MPLAGDLLLFFGGVFGFLSLVGWFLGLVWFFIWTSLDLDPCVNFRVGRSAGSILLLTGSGTSL